MRPGSIQISSSREFSTAFSASAPASSRSPSAGSARSPHLRMGGCVSRPSGSSSRTRLALATASAPRYSLRSPSRVPSSRRPRHDSTTRCSRRPSHLPLPPPRSRAREREPCHLRVRRSMPGSGRPKRSEACGCRELRFDVWSRDTGDRCQRRWRVLRGAWSCSLSIGRCGGCSGTSCGCSSVSWPGLTPAELRDGGFADFVVVPSRRYLLPLAGLEPLRAAPLADAGVTPYRAVRRIGEFLGQFAIQYLRLLTGAWVVAVDPVAAKRRRALELGADEAHRPEEMQGQVRVVLDFVGSDESLALAAAIVERSGFAVVVGEGGGQVPFALDLVPWEASFTSSVWGSLEDLRAVVELAGRGEIDWYVETL